MSDKVLRHLGVRLPVPRIALRVRTIWETAVANGIESEIIGGKLDLRPCFGCGQSDGSEV